MRAEAIQELSAQEQVESGFSAPNVLAGTEIKAFAVTEILSPCLTVVNSLLSVAKDRRSKLGTRESAIHHQLDRVDV